MRKYRFVTVFDLLIDYIRSGRIRIDRKRFPQLVTYHDPCNYGRKAHLRFGHGYFEEPRWILDHCVERWVELYPNRMNQTCCGGGGGTLTNGFNEERIHYGRRKMEQIRSVEADLVAVPCHSCHAQLENIKKTYGMGALEVKYLWELVADALVLG